MLASLILLIVRWQMVVVEPTPLLKQRLMQLLPLVLISVQQVL